MTKLSPKQQIDALRPTLGFAAHLHYVLLGGAALGLIIAIVFWHPVPLMFALFLAIVGLSEHKAGPNIVAAINAYDTHPPTMGTAQISLTEGDSSPHYHVTLIETGYANWAYEFIPQDWQPVACSCPAKIWRNANNQAPELAITEAGVLIPRYEPHTLPEAPCKHPV